MCSWGEGCAWQDTEPEQLNFPKGVVISGQGEVEGPGKHVRFSGGTLRLGEGGRGSDEGSSLAKM
jgi:hypothetical protein